MHWEFFFYAIKISHVKLYTFPKFIELLITSSGWSTWQGSRLTGVLSIQFLKYPTASGISKAYGDSTVFAELPVSFNTHANKNESDNSWAYGATSTGVHAKVALALLR